MRVGLNATCFDDRPSGARQRFEGIYGALIRDNPSIDFTIFEPRDVRVAQWFRCANVTAVRTPIRAGGTLRRVTTERRYWPGALAQAKLDLFETFNLPLVEAPGCPTILTIHDIRYVQTGVGWPRRWINARITRRALNRADRIVTVSNTIRDEILDFQAGTNVTTIYNGVDASSFARMSHDECQHALHRLGISTPYALAVGHLETRKNYPILLEAFARLRDRNDPLRLVIVGKDGGSKTEIEQSIITHGLEDRVVILDGVDDISLRALYSECELVVFPSRYEGFGIPVLEAMAARKPVVLSDIPVFCELTEGQGCYFPVTDAVALTRCIEAVSGDPELRQRLIRYGDNRLPSFTFRTLAAQIAELYRSILSGKATASASPPTPDPSVQ